MQQAALDVVHRLRQAGHEAYLVGGCVRDFLLGIEPEDWDVATSATPDQAAPLFERRREVGRAFGVLQVEAGGTWIEVATFRSEGPYTDARHPDQVRFTDARQDALRRDFTINALFFDPDRNEVLDFVGGRADLEKRVLRCVGDPRERFAEDALRLLRAVRFACRFDLEIDPGTWGAMRAQAGGLAAISAERIRDEFLSVLTGPRPRRGLELLHDSGLLHQFAPEVAALRGVAQAPAQHPEGDVWEHTVRMLELQSDRDAELALGALLHDIGKPATRSVSGAEVHFYGHVERGQEIAARLLERWRIPVRTREAVQAMIGQHMRVLDAPGMKRSTLRRFVLQEHFPRVLELHRLDALASRGDLASWDLCRRELEELRQRAEPGCPLLSGHDLQDLGYLPCPRLGAILRSLVDAQLDGEVGDREQAQAWVRRHHAPDAPPRGTDPGGEA